MTANDAPQPVAWTCEAIGKTRSLHWSKTVALREANKHRGDRIVEPLYSHTALATERAARETAERERDAARAALERADAGLISAFAILDGEHGDWAEHFYSDWIIMDYARDAVRAALAGTP